MYFNVFKSKIFKAKLSLFLLKHFSLSTQKLFFYWIFSLFPFCHTDIHKGLAYSTVCSDGVCCAELHTANSWGIASHRRKILHSLWWRELKHTGRRNKKIKNSAFRCRICSIPIHLIQDVMVISFASLLVFYLSVSYVEAFHIYSKRGMGGWRELQRDHGNHILWP